jgi:cytochrome c-type biogenesis protein CcmH
MQLPFLIISFLLMFSAPLVANSEAFVFASSAEQADFEQLQKEMRCVTCPNQSIADSNAPVAKAMQEEIYLRIKQGQSQQDIRQYLLAHYGDFVSYRPQMKQQTWFLWIGPFLFLLIGAFFWLRHE